MASLRASRQSRDSELVEEAGTSTASSGWKTRSRWARFLIMSTARRSRCPIGLAAEDVLDSRVPDIADQRVEAIASELLQERRVDRLRAVLVHLHGDAGPIPRPAEVLVELVSPEFRAAVSVAVEVVARRRSRR